MEVPKLTRKQEAHLKALIEYSSYKDAARVFGLTKNGSRYFISAIAERFGISGGKLALIQAAKGGLFYRDFLNRKKFLILQLQEIVLEENEDKKFN
jgi:hypothetical protein